MRITQICSESSSLKLQFGLSGRNTGLLPSGRLFESNGSKYSEHQFMEQGKFIFLSVFGLSLLSQWPVFLHLISWDIYIKKEAEKNKIIVLTQHCAVHL